MKKYLFLILILCTQSGIAQLNPERVARFCDSLLLYGINKPMIPGAILSVLSADTVYLLEGYGYSNYQQEIPVDPDETLFQLGSVGKLFTAIAALQQVEAGQLEPDKSINDYLQGWQIEHSYDRDITLFDLLTHTAGFNDHVIGYMARSENEILPLSEYLKKSRPGLFQEPGSSINYSNYGYALAGHLAANSAGKTFKEYIQEFLFDPLKMGSSTYYLPDDYTEKSNYARGYQWRETFEEVSSYPRHATPAGSINSTASDMSVFMQAILKKDTQLLSEPFWHLLLDQQFTNHQRLSGYSMGMEIQNFNGYGAVAKAGQVPGFLSILLLFPEDDLGLFISLNTETDNFLELFFTEFRKEFFSTQKAQISEKIDQSVDEYVGHYANQRSNNHTIEELFMLYAGHFELFKSKDNNLLAWHNGGWQEYVMTEQDVFQNKESTDIYITFSRNENGELNGMYRNVVVGGIQIPSSYRKLGWFERPRFMNDEYPFLLMIVPSYFVLVLVWMATWLIRKRKPGFLAGTRIPVYYHATALLFLFLFIWNISGFFLPLLKNRSELFFDFNQALYSMRYFNWIMAIASVSLLILSIHIWVKKSGNWLIRLYFTLYSLVAFSYILLLHRWHFLNITYQ
ncbi:MAG: serine hydrolase domain-containing protein [Cyclobacteriaceae bacterium]